MATSEKSFNVTKAQLEGLWAFLNSHRDIAMGYNESTETRNHYRRMWERVTQSLNSLEGDTRDWKGWSTDLQSNKDSIEILPVDTAGFSLDSYWIDYKARLKKKIAAIEAAEAQVGGSSRAPVPLTDIEKKFYDILGNNNGLGTSRMPIDPFSDELIPCSSAASSTSDWVNANDHSTQTPFEPFGSTSVSTQSLDMDETTLSVYGNVGAPQKTTSTETERPVVAATQTLPIAAQLTSSAGAVRRRRRPSTLYPTETRRSLSVAAITPNGLATRNNNFGGMIGVLSRMVRALERIEARLNGPQLTGI